MKFNEACGGSYMIIMWMAVFFEDHYQNFLYESFKKSFDAIWVLNFLFSRKKESLV